MLTPSRPGPRPAAPSALASRPRRARRQSPGLEVLEGRQLLSLGAELVGNAFGDGPQELPVTASAPDGRSVVAWVDRTNPSNRRIEFRLFKANGTTTALDTTVQASGANASDPSVAMDQNGNFVVTWSQQDNVLAQRFNANGGALGGVITVAGTGLIENSPDVAMDRNGNFVVVYEQASSANPSTTRDVAAKRFSSGGTFLGASNTFSGPGFQELRPSVAMASDGRFAIAYEFFANGNEGNSQIFAISYNANGTSNASSLVAGSAAEEEKPDIAMRDNGEYTVVYQKGPFANTDIKAQRVSFNGTAFGEINISNSSRREVDPRIVMNRNGFGFVVAFDSFGSGGSRVGVVEVKGNNQVNFTTTVTAAINPALSLGPEGQYQLAYQRTANGSNNVFRRRGSGLAN
ncbi:MAG: hypothetical protein U0800_20195 [Isosphaeraceae bacterium]